ncbi:MAG: DUF4175 domain-containing protein [Planctomycetota bacterium]|nr:DUF4175 domain-containing protein [Planctomycetota bacterium]
MTKDDLLIRISALRGQIRRLLATYGLARAAALVLGLLLVEGWADWSIHLASPLRFLELAGTIAALLWALRTFFLKPLLTNFDDLALALKIEDRWPGLQDRLASAVEFLELRPDATTSDNASPELRKRVIDQAYAEVEKIDFSQAIDTHPARQSLKFLGIAAALSLLSIILGPQSSRLAMTRLLNPLSGPEWPKATQLKWLEASPKVALGEPWSLVVKVEEGYKIPSSAVAEFTFADGEKALEPLRVVEGGEFRGRLESVTQSFKVRVRAGDDLTETKPVEAVTPPRLSDLKIVVQPPDYTSLPAITLAPGSAQIRTVEESLITISAKASKTLASANLKFADSAQKPPTVQMDPTLQGFTVSWHATRSTGVSIDLTDSEGFTSKDQGRLDQQVVPDTAPRVVLEDPATDRDITPQAVVPLKIDLEDDFGINQVTRKYALTSGSGDPGETLVKPLWTAVPGQPMVKKNKISERWDLAPLGLTPGAMITLSIEANDFKTPNGPNIGKSREIRLRVISAQEAARQMEDQRREIREETERVLAMQKQANRPVDDARRTLAQTKDQLPEASKQELSNAEQVQKQVGDRLNNPADGLARKVDRFMQDLDNLKLQNPEAADQMKGLKQALAKLEEGPVPQAEQALNRANRGLDNRQENPAPTENRPGAQAQPKAANQGNAQAQSKSADPAKQAAEATKAGQQTAQTKQAEAAKQAGEQAKAGGQQAAQAKQAGEQAKAGGQQAAQAKQAVEQQAESGPQAAPEQALAQAQDAQKQITDALQQMLGEMSQLESVRGLINEAKQLAGNQEELNKAIEEAANNPELMGKNPENLPPDQKAGLENQAARQNELAKQLQELQQRLGEMANRMAQQDPIDAAGLQEAADNSRQKGTSGKMNQAAEQIAKNQNNAARQGQEQALKEVKQLADDIQNRKEKELSRLVKQLKQAEEEMRNLKRAQVENLIKTQEAAKQADPAKRKAELQQLARQEQQLQEEAKRQLQKLQRMRSASQAAQAGQKAAGKMAQAQQKMDADDAEAAEQNQEEALKNLDEAEQELAQARQEAEEQLAQEQFVKMSDLIKSLAERQGKMVEETLGYDKKKTDTGSLSLPQKAGVRNLGLVEDGLKQETVELAERMDDGVPVFSLILKKAADSMGKASESLQQLDTGKPTQQSEKNAAERLQQLIDSLQPDKPKDGQQQQQQQQQQGEQQQGQQQEGDGIPTTAQLKMLKRLQTEINNRTNEYDKMASGGQKLTGEQKADLDSLKTEQGRLADLLRDLSKPKRSDGEN